MRPWNSAQLYAAFEHIQHRLGILLANAPDAPAIEHLRIACRALREADDLLVRSA